MESFQGQLSLRHTTHDKLLIMAVVVCTTIGYLFWQLVSVQFVPQWDVTLLALVNLLFIYPLTEEIIFRGVIQESLLTIAALGKRLYGISIANIITSCLFAGLHALNQPLILSVFIALPSLVLGFFKQRYSTLLISVGLHILFNATFLLSILTRTHQ